MFADTATEELILEFVRNQEACRKKWHATVLENAELKKQIASLTETNVELERKLAHTKEVLRKELQRRERCEEETQQKQRQLEQVRDILVNNKICDETAEKLSVIMPIRTGSQDHPVRMSIIESVGSVLSPSGDDLDVSEDSAGGIDTPGPQGKRRHNFFDGLSPLGKKSKINDDGDQLRANVVHTTVNTTDGQDPVATARVVTQLPTPSVPDVPTPPPPPPSQTPASSTPTMTPKYSSGSAPNTPVAQRRGKAAASAAMPRRSNSAEKLLSRQHAFCPKTVIKTETCGPCGKRTKFYKTVFRCSRCNAICHPECKHQVPLPCIPVCDIPKRSGTGNRRGTLISDHAPSTAPMVPALVVHCIQEVERRGLDSVGIYRVSGSEREVREIRERFQQGKGVPNLSKADIYAVCGVLKAFLLSLRESLITKSLWHTFVRATELEHEDRVWAMWQAVTQLPPANRDTLAALVLHLQTVAAHPGTKMPLSNLARVFAPTVVGCSINDTASVPNLFLEMAQQNQVMEALLSLPADYWNQLLDA
ncbi:rac GTPase-activating protein 1 [Rhipicephalus sanguineus]|uniref:rac GTPase-activating protein 1 n=1 Tax=Rhipicephalus sanguineus TaxID=34632 RepID=UPI0020C3FB66|nr:rac GTPase-activating protein 1 [Rhipicephalus sanguineus]